MSDWLERELARGLAPVAAPDALGIRLGFAHARRWEFPRVALALAFTVVMIIAGAYAASRTAALGLSQLDLRPLAARELHGTGTRGTGVHDTDARGTDTVGFASADPVAVAAWVRREAGVDVPLRPARGVQLTGARLILRHGVRVAAISMQENGVKATVLIAHAGPAVEGAPACKISGHALAAAPEAGCHLCHSL